MTSDTVSLARLDRSFLSILTLVLTFGISAAQEDAKIPEEAERVALEADLVALEKTFEQKPTKADERDKLRTDRLKAVDSLVKRWPAFEDKQRTRFRAILERLFDDKNDDAKRRVIETLGKMSGGDKDKESAASSKALLKHHDSASIAEVIELRTLALRQVGILAHPSAVAALLDLLNDKETKIVVASIDALAGYKKATTTVRKEIFEKVLKTIPSERGGGGAGGGARPGGARPNRPTNDRTFDDNRAKAIGDAADKTLEAVTKTKFSGQEEWMRWWNKEGKKTDKWP